MHDEICSAICTLLPAFLQRMSRCILVLVPRLLTSCMRSTAQVVCMAYQDSSRRYVITSTGCGGVQLVMGAANHWQVLTYVVAVIAG